LAEGSSRATTAGAPTSAATPTTTSGSKKRPRASDAGGGAGPGPGGQAEVNKRPSRKTGPVDLEGNEEIWEGAMEIYQREREERRAAVERWAEQDEKVSLSPFIPS
jgi:hypothetical protein